MAAGYWAIRTWRAGPVGEKIKYWVPGRRPEGKGAVKRDRNLKKAAQNLQNAVKTLARLINENFLEGDLLAGLDYSDKALQRLRNQIPGWDAMNKAEQQEAEWKAARQNLTRFIRKLRDQAKKRGIELRYVTITSDLDGETGEVDRVHHHLIVNREAKQLLWELWQDGGADYEPLSAQPDYTPIAAYMIRQVRHVEDAKKYTSSRNLRRPEPKDQIAKSAAVLRAPKGALLVDAGSNVPGQAQYIRYIISDAVATGEEAVRRGVKIVRAVEGHRRPRDGEGRSV